MQNKQNRFTTKMLRFQHFSERLDYILYYMVQLRMREREIDSGNIKLRVAEKRKWFSSLKPIE